MPTIKNSQPKLPKDKPQKQPRIPTDEELRCDNPVKHVPKTDSDPMRFKLPPIYENEDAKKHPYKYDPKAKTTLVKADGTVIYTY